MHINGTVMKRGKEVFSSVQNTEE